MKIRFTLVFLICCLTSFAQNVVAHIWNENYELPCLPEQVGKLDVRGAKNLDSLFQELPKFKNITWLNMWGLGIEELPETLFDSITNLTWLDLGKNQIKELPTSFNQLKRITHLGLYNNKLKHLPKLVYDLQLIELRVQNNQLADTFGISPSWKRLEQLNLSGNNINWIIGLSYLRKIERFTLSGCAFAELPNEFQKCRKLKYFYINGNPIESLPKSLLRLPKLWYILLDKTNIPDELLYEYGREYPRKTFDDCPTC